MKKSSGKWIKTVLFGKKCSKSSYPKGREKGANEREVLVVARASETDVALCPPFSSQLNPNAVERDERKLELENKEVANILHDDGISLPITQGTDSQKSTLHDSLYEQAATMVQAAFRGYLERKLVVSLGVNMPARIGKLSANAFVHKLVASSPTVMLLCLNFDAEEPNSVWNWLEHWSASCFWKPVPRPEKVSDSKFQRKQANGQAVEMDTGQPKQSVRRIPPANLDGTSVQATCEFDKPKRNLRKVSSHPPESVQENPQNELEKVKRNLRKVHNPVVENSMHPEVGFEKPKQSLDEELSATNLDIVEQSLNSSAEKTSKEMALMINCLSDKVKKEMAMTVNSSAEKREEMATVNSCAEKMKEIDVTVNVSAEKMRKEMTVAVSKSPEIETTQGPSGMNETSDLFHADSAAIDPKSWVDRTISDENTPITNAELNRNDDSANNENQKSCRKASNPAKRDCTENGPRSSPQLPSYMAATESAKAKLRLQGSPQSGQDRGDKNNITRHRSLPSSANSKISSQSARTQRPVHAVKLGSKSDGSTLSSKDENAKATQIEWRR